MAKPDRVKASEPTRSEAVAKPEVKGENRTVKEIAALGAMAAGRAGSPIKENADRPSATIAALMTGAGVEPLFRRVNSTVEDCPTCALGRKTVPKGCTVTVPAGLR